MAVAVVAAAAGLTGCGSAGVTPPAPPTGSGGLAPDQLPIPAGRGPRFRLPAVSPGVAGRARIAGQACATVHPPSYGVHLELYADRLVLPVPSGIGVAPPQQRRGVYVLGGACSYGLRTLEPTGVVVVDRGARAAAPTLGTLFAIWGQPLSAGSLAGFDGPVVAFLGGRRWSGSPQAIPLRRHAEIVLQVGGELPPHPAYLFPPGL